MHIPVHVHHAFEFDAAEGELVQSQHVGVDSTLHLRQQQQNTRYDEISG